MGAGGKWGSQDRHLEWWVGGWVGGGEVFKKTCDVPPVGGDVDVREPPPGLLLGGRGGGPAPPPPLLPVLSFSRPRMKFLVERIGAEGAREIF